MSEAPKGLVFNIQKFSLHDGPGIRTIVFLKGCPLACIWCSNPEGQLRAPELIHCCDRCIGTEECDRCIGACTVRAIRKDGHGGVVVNRDRCDGCGDCADVCPSQALERSGQWLSVDEVLRIVDEDDAFYARSGGGLTLSGGEPLSQGAFALALLRAARNRGVDTAIETSGLCNWKTLCEAASLADQIIFDVKCLDGAKHELATGVSNAKILENFRKLRGEFPKVEVVVRTPVVPGINDTVEDIRAIADFIEEAGGAKAYEVLPYHGFGEPKYERLGKHYRLSHLEPPSAKRMHELSQIASRFGAAS